MTAREYMLNQLTKIIGKVSRDIHTVVIFYEDCFGMLNTRSGYFIENSEAFSFANSLVDGCVSNHQNYALYVDGYKIADIGIETLLACTKW